MLEIALCGNESDQREKLNRLVRDYLGQRPELTARLFDFESSAALLGAAEDRTGFDLYLLDVLMPEMSGIELGGRLRKLDGRGIIIYLSASSDYAVEAYRVRAFDYLLKPVEAERLFPVLDRAMAFLDWRKSAQVMVKTRSTTCLIPVDNIQYIELANRAARYHLSGGEVINSVTLRGSFREEESVLLADPRFILCGSSLVVNLHYVTAAEGSCFRLNDGSTVTLPRRSAAWAKRAWANYWLSSGQNCPNCAEFAVSIDGTGFIL